MNREGKTNWDYFCQLMEAIPGLNAVFSDDYLQDAAAGKERGERAVAAYRQVQDADGKYFMEQSEAVE